MRHPASAYRQLSVQGASPLGLVVMLYDGAIAEMRRAAQAIEAHDIQKKCDHLNRALAIIAHLEGTLNFEKGGEVARTLKALYVYARGQVTKANLEDSTEILKSLIEKITSVREAWYEADHRPTPSQEASHVGNSSGNSRQSGSWRTSG
jgi:flagellar protein FliS